MLVAGRDSVWGVGRGERHHQNTTRLLCRAKQLTGSALPFPFDRPESNQNDLQIADGEIESNWDQVVDNFDNMDLKPELLRGIYAYG